MHKLASGNWIVDNLNVALETWNDKLSEIWQLLTQSPETFKGGAIWNVVVNIHGALQAIGYASLVLFFVIGVVKTCGSFAEINTHYRTQKEKHPPIVVGKVLCFRIITLFQQVIVKRSKSNKCS